MADLCETPFPTIDALSQAMKAIPAAAKAAGEKVVEEAKDVAKAQHDVAKAQIDGALAAAKAAQEKAIEARDEAQKAKGEVSIDKGSAAGAATSIAGAAGVNDEVANAVKLVQLCQKNKDGFAIAPPMTDPFTAAKSVLPINFVTMSTAAIGDQFPTQVHPSLEAMNTAVAMQANIMLNILKTLMSAFEAAPGGGLPFPAIPGLPNITVDMLLEMDPKAIVESLISEIQIPEVPDFKSLMESAKEEGKSYIDALKEIELPEGFDVWEELYNSIKSVVPLPELWPDFTNNEQAAITAIQTAINNYLTIAFETILSVVDLLIGYLETLDPVPGIPTLPTFPITASDITSLLPEPLVSDVSIPSWEAVQAEAASAVNDIMTQIEAIANYTLELPIVKDIFVLPTACDVFPDLSGIELELDLPDLPDT